MKSRVLSLDMWERRPPSHRTFILLIAAKLEITHHRFGVPASPERESVELQSILSGVWCFWRVVGFVYEPAGVAVEPSICFFQTSASGLDEEVVYERQQRHVDDAVDEVVAPSEVMDARRSCLNDEVVAEPVAGSCCGGSIVSMNMTIAASGSTASGGHLPSDAALPRMLRPFTSAA
jgi:hypothetical protein